MPRRYVALLRAITNVSMQPFRREMDRMRFTDVESYGTSGNVLFNAKQSDTSALERRIAARLGTTTIVRTRRALLSVVAHDPFRSTILFLAHTPTAAARRTFLRLDFTTPRPVLRGKTVFFVFPAKLRGKRTPFDFERALGVQGTFRTARVVRRLLARMS